MNAAQKVLFIDRDGTLIEEPADQQIDSLDKLRLIDGMIPALLRLQAAGYTLVMVSNQDGRGTASFPEESFRKPHAMLMAILQSQGVRFVAEFFCPHFAKDNCECRKPKTGLLTEFLQSTAIDKLNSYVIGDRETDLELARNLGVHGIRFAAPSPQPLPGTERGSEKPLTVPGETTRHRMPRIASQEPNCVIPAQAGLQDLKNDSRLRGNDDSPFQYGEVSGQVARSAGEGCWTWAQIAKQLCSSNRHAQVTRKTKETDIAVEVNLDSESPIHIETGLAFFDHMIEQIAKHGGFALNLTCKGDLQIDEHHTVEDCAIALGAALKQALGDKRGIARFGFLLPMDETLAQIAIDLSGRGYFVFEGKFNREFVGQLPTELVPHFFRSLAESLGAAINIKVTGENTHHMVEACFKGLGRTFRQAFRIEGTELPSSKGVL